MQQASIHIRRYDPETDGLRTQTYSILLHEGDTVLQVLQRIHEEQDPTLAFRHGCRSFKCGQCVLEVDGMPHLACKLRARDGMTVSPMKNLPMLRDLIVDRLPLDERLSTQRLYVVSEKPRPFETFTVTEVYESLIGCLECYGCVATCPKFDWRNDIFGGPYVFVRLAALHLDPRNTIDRKAQARSLNIEEFCQDCNSCRCVKGIAIRRDAIGTLLGKPVDKPNQE